VRSIGVGGHWLTVPDVLDAESQQHPIVAHSGASSAIAWGDLRTYTAVAICQNRMTKPTYGGLADVIRMAIREAAQAPTQTI